MQRRPRHVADLEPAILLERCQEFTVVVNDANGTCGVASKNSRRDSRTIGSENGLNR